ncbi:hypothetical protein CN311_04390 [Mesorhizobium sanjuanii]|jgi:mannitol-specific phosphotransferase system IIBC component|uniref:Uncharacterized protein n=2 Tax=Mesorhizobium TaxID=68287 RepID=A0A2A6FKN7_9HYPH|nr:MULTISPECIES: hypothetical protein [Mesorhizobium]PDQ22295.1 hypothetical protein CN311_04390 [Mesorhizobium sanjuanii]PTE10051.1 hypothetical protein C9427_13110 [Mesorhizobium helmanticense]
MDRDTRNAAIGAAWVLLLFGIAAYYLPTVMLAVGSVSTVLAGVVAAVFMVAIFVVFWLRGRNQRKKGL